MTLQPGDLSALLGVPFTDEQLVAATAPLEPAVVVAGAGSGKTSVMAARVVWLVASGQVHPEEVLGLTFTNKAAAELAQRIRAALAKALGGSSPAASREAPFDGEPTVATYHAYAGRLLREHGLRIGVEPAARLLADATRFQLAERVVRRAPGPFPDLEGTVSHLVGKVVTLDGELNEHLVGVAALQAEDARIVATVSAVPGPTAGQRDVVATARRRSQLAELVGLLRAEKERTAVLDFGDQVAHAVRLVQQHPVVGATERGRYRVVLLDEYQDTSVAQKLLLLGLFGGGHPVTAVGDPFQAIYGWRGASVANIDRFPEEFRTADGHPARRFGLGRNNRSGGLLLSLANRLAEPLRVHHPGVPELVPRPEVAEQGEIVCALLPTHADEVAWVAGGIAARIAQGVRPRDIAVLVRVRSDFAAYHDALVERGIPVEVVGLGGLLALPEVADLVATLEVLDDPTANPALVRLLAGPRWQIGPRDLALLGRRAAELVRVDRRSETQDAEEVDEDAGPLVRSADVADLLAEAVAGIDSAEVVSLAEALESPGGLPYAEPARERFARLARELAGLRRHLGDPLLDLLHRVIATTGLDVEVAAAPGASAALRSDGLAAFLDQAAAFADLDGDPSVRAFLAFLSAAQEYERGLDTTAPSPSDSVKLMTVHKAKGLEWPVVVVPDLTHKVFPADRGRRRFTTAPEIIPTALRGDADAFPVITDWSTSGLRTFADRMKDLDRLEELRLAYVAVTRAKSTLVASAHWWGPTQLKPRGPSEYLTTLREACESGLGTVVQWAAEPTQEANPVRLKGSEHGWPVPLDPERLAARRDGAELVRLALSGAPSPPDPPALTAADRDRVSEWDRDLTALLDEARRAHRVDLDVPLPASLSATALVRLAADPDGLARDLARPLPRPPAPAARRGTRFHAWVESLFGQRALLDRDDLEGAADDDLVPDESLAALQTAFLAGPYGARPPHRVEAPFQLVLGGRIVRGRIDAVYRTQDGGYEVVDWKTGDSTADPLQLAVYRAAWARVVGVPEADVGACFYYVATGLVSRPEALPTAEDLERLLSVG